MQQWGRVRAMAIAALMIAGCEGGGGGLAPDLGPPQAPGDDACANGCNWLASCNWCDQDPNGQCLTPTECASACRADGAGQIFACLADLDYCDAVRIDGCYANGIVDDDPPDDDPPPEGDGCEAGCVALDSCGLCAEDDAGECLPTADCVDNCRGEESEAQYECYAEIEVCDEALFAACAEGEEPPDDPPADGCDAGCQALDACGFCIPDDAGECVSVEICGDGCRDDGSEALFQCYAEVEMCSDEGFAACEDTEPDPRCPAGCATLSACGLICGPEGCETCGGEDEAPCPTEEACVEQCVAEAAEAAYDCASDVEACDVEAAAACLAEPEIPDQDTCAVGCGRLDECGYCFTGADDDCISAEACVEQCRADEPGNLGIEMCLSGLAMCDDAAIDTCFSAEADACDIACITVERCDRCAPGPNGACLSAFECAAFCREADTDIATCVGEVQACDPAALDACLGVEPEPEPEPEIPAACVEACATDCDPCIPGDEPDACLAEPACLELCASAADPALCAARLSACDADPGVDCAP